MSKYGIYSDSDTESQHLLFVEWAGIKLTFDQECDFQTKKGFILSKDLWNKFRKNQTKVFKHMDKLPKRIKVKELPAIGLVSEDLRLEDWSKNWQMLLAFYYYNDLKHLDTKNNIDDFDNLSIPEEVFTNGVAGTKFLMGLCADSWSSPSGRRRALKKFLNDVEYRYKED